MFKYIKNFQLVRAKDQQIGNVRATNSVGFPLLGNNLSERKQLQRKRGKLAELVMVE